MKSHALRDQLSTRGCLLLVYQLSLVLLLPVVFLLSPAVATGERVSAGEFDPSFYRDGEPDGIEDLDPIESRFIGFYDDPASVPAKAADGDVLQEEFHEFLRPTREVRSSSMSATNKRFTSSGNASAAFGAARSNTLSRSRKAANMNNIMEKQINGRERDSPCFASGRLKSQWRNSPRRKPFLRPRSLWDQPAGGPETRMDQFLKLAEETPTSDRPFICDGAYNHRARDVDCHPPYFNWLNSAPFRPSYGHLPQYLLDSATPARPVESIFTTRRFLNVDELDVNGGFHTTPPPDRWGSHHSMHLGTSIVAWTVPLTFSFANRMVQHVTYADEAWHRFDDTPRNRYLVPNRSGKVSTWHQQPYAWKWMLQGSSPGSRDAVRVHQGGSMRSFLFDDIAANALERIEKEEYATTPSTKPPTTAPNKVTTDPHSPASGTPYFKHRALFRSASDGYSVYRIPTIIRSKKGTLLVFSEARKHSVVDHGQIDIVYRRSTDNGKTWEPSRVLINGRGHSVSNPAPVADLKTGAIVLLFCRSPSSTREVLIRFGKAPPRTVWMTRSLDDGYTWTYPTEITNSVREEDWSWYATGPVHGIQLKSGRLVIPCNHVVGANGAGGWTDRSHVVISDDSGRTWRIGGISRFGTNEATVAQIKNGSLYLNSRNMLSKKQRFSAWSHDDGITFRDGRFEPDLIEPSGNGCQGSVLRVPDERSNAVLLFANPATIDKDRRNMTIIYSLDEGRTWEGSRTAYPGPSAYSDMAVATDGLITLVYERGRKEYYESIAIDQFNLAWLLEKESSNRKRSSQQKKKKRMK